MALPSDARLGRDDPLPVPYVPGKCLGFRVVESFHTPTITDDDAYLVIERVHSITISPVMDVTVVPQSGQEIHAVLKVYDRRFGTDLRSVYREHVPCTLANEQTYQHFAKSGKMRPFLDELAKSREYPTDSIDAADFLDDDGDEDSVGADGGGGESHGGDDQDRIAHYEAALWQTTQDHFACETKAYARLLEFQGKSIPRMFGHVCLRPPPGDTDPAVVGKATAASTAETAPYSEVKGILVERISGYSIWDLPISPLAPQDPAVWPAIVQAAIDAAEAINSHVIMMRDGDARNVIVDQHSRTPYIIDFAQCDFKEDLIAFWEGLDAKGKARFRDEFDPEWVWSAEAHWWQQLHTLGNPRAIGAVAAMRVRQEKGIEMQLEYPKFLKISAAIRQQAHGRSEDA